MKPEFTANELDWDDDPEKVILDFNYKSFFEDDEEEKKDRKLLTELKNRRKDESVKKKSNVHFQKAFSLRGKVKRAHKYNISSGKVKSTLKYKVYNGSESNVKDLMKYMLITRKKKTNKRKKKLKSDSRRRRRSRRSLVEEEEEDEDNNEDEDFQDALDEDNSDEDNSDEETLRSKRDIMAILKKAQTKLAEKLAEKIKRNNIPTANQNKRQNISKHIENNIKGTKGFITDQQLKLLESNDAVQKKANIKNPKKPKEGELGDEQIKQNIVKNIIRTSTETQQEVFPKSKLLMPTAKLFKKAIKDAKAVTREKIPKVDMNIVPSNVARAVAMAMEQLKRDRMWGKVFVHVRPSGQLKVMVQETKKMDENR